MIPQGKRDLAFEMFRDGTDHGTIRNFVGLTEDEMDSLVPTFEAALQQEEAALKRQESTVGKPLKAKED